MYLVCRTIGLLDYRSDPILYGPWPDQGRKWTVIYVHSPWPDQGRKRTAIYGEMDGYNTYTVRQKRDTIRWLYASLARPRT
jgi:hypothetical protein